MGYDRADCYPKRKHREEQQNQCRQRNGLARDARQERTVAVAWPAMAITRVPARTRSRHRHEEHINQNDVLPDDVAKEMVWTLSSDCKTVRLSLPPLPLDGLPEPIKVDMDLDVATVDVIFDRLVDLRSQMASPEAGAECRQSRRLSLHIPRLPGSLGMSLGKASLTTWA